MCVVSDIDECYRQDNACHKFATCQNTIGSFTCTCQDGYYGDGILSCESNEKNKKRFFRKKNILQIVFNMFIKI